MSRLPATIDTEDAPLLATIESLPPFENAPKPTAGWRQRNVITVALLCLFMIEVCQFMQVAPLQRIIEDISCRRWYEQHSPSAIVDGRIDESMCKLKPIQSTVGMLLGWDATFTYLPALFLAVPYALMADVKGRRPVLLLSIAGILGAVWFQIFILYLECDLRFMWFANAFYVIGGGPSVALSTISAMIADTAAPERRAFTFNLLPAFAYGSSLIASPFASRTMMWTPWLPLIVSGGMATLGAFLSFTIAETLGSSVNDPAAIPDETRPLISRQISELVPTKETTISVLVKSIMPVHFFKAPTSVKLISIGFLANAIARQSLTFMLALATERFHWSLAKTNFLLPLFAGSQLVVLLVVTPALSKFLTDTAKIAPVRRDFMLACGSAIIAFTGCLSIGLSPVPGMLIASTIVFASGIGFPGACRAVLTALTPPEDIAGVFAVMAVFDTTGGIISGWLLAESFSKGLSMGGLWSGLPFTVGASFYLFALLMFTGVRLPKSSAPEDLDEDR